MIRDMFADGIIKNKKKVIKVTVPTEDTDISERMDWIEFIAYPTNFKPISIDTSLR